MKKVNIISTVFTETNYIFISDTGNQYIINKGDESKQDFCSDLNLRLLEDNYVEVLESDLLPTPQPNIFDMFNQFTKEVKLQFDSMNQRIDDIANLKVTVAGTDIDVAPIANHIKHAVESGNTVGIENLIKRMSNIKSKHSVEDLLLFLKNTDLPITDNGDILFYKKVTKTEYNSYPVDNHTRKIPQAEFSIISMHPSLVDPDRRSSCSYGLHVASFDYAVSFGGNRVLIGLVRPEDVIAVPEYEHTKMRVCSYLILEYLNKDEFEAFNRGILSDSLKSKLAKYVSGYIPEASTKVEIQTKTVSSYSDIKVTSLAHTSSKQEEKVSPEFNELNTVEEVTSLDDVLQKLKINKEAHKPASHDFNELQQRYVHKAYVLGMEEEFIAASTQMVEFITKYRSDIKDLINTYGSLSALVDTDEVRHMELIFSTKS